MKKLVAFCLLCVLFSCKKSDEISGNGQLLTQITASNKPYQTFEYSGTLLVKENMYGLCEKNPSDEYFYSYQGSKLTKLKSILRGIYSSTTAMCDPASPGDQSEESFEYDAQNRIVKVTRQKSYTEYIYNAQGQVEKLVLYGGTNPLTATFKYDSKGNIIETTDYSGYTAKYEYDDKVNPFYVINQKPSWISPFNKSPNNIVKTTWAQGNYTRTLKYNSLGLPAEIEENGQTYFYTYR